MLNKENIELCWAALAKYGISSQRLMVVEECSELIKAICKRFRDSYGYNKANDNNYKEEIVDVIVMLQQMLLADGIAMEEVNRRAKAKLERALK